MKIPEGGFGEWMCSSEVALELEISVQAVHRLHYRRTLVGTMRGGQRWWRRSAVLAMKNSADHQKRSRRLRNEGEELPELPGIEVEKGPSNG